MGLLAHVLRNAGVLDLQRMKEKKDESAGGMSIDGFEVNHKPFKHIRFQKG